MVMLGGIVFVACVGIVLAFFSQAGVAYAIDEKKGEPPRKTESKQDKAKKGAVEKRVIDDRKEETSSKEAVKPEKTKKTEAEKSWRPAQHEKEKTSETGKK